MSNGSYNYGKERPWLFTEEGSNLFIKVRDGVLDKIKENGAVRFDKINFYDTCETYKMIAIMDRMIELKDIEIWERLSWQQYKIYADPQRHNQ